MAEPVFSASDLGRLFGLADGTAWTIAKRWIADGVLSATVQEGGTASNYGRTIRVAPAAVLAFVRQHPDAYDWRKITDPLLKAEAERVEKRDPLVPLDQAIAGKGLTKADVLLLAKKGTPGVVTRFAKDLPGRGPSTREYFIRRSALSKLTAALEKERLRSDPLAALHALLQVPEAAPAPTNREQASAQAAAHATAVGPRSDALVALEDAQRCPKCKARRLLSASLDGQELVCMSCGESETIVDRDAEARTEARRQAEVAAIRAEATETRRLQGQGGPGRPKAVAS